MKDSKLKIDIRRNKILEILRRDGKVYVKRLSEELDVSVVTVRNDLCVLEQEGKLIRMAGGAMPASGLSITESKISNFDVKKEIALAAAELIKDGDTLFINSGTTSQLVAAELYLKKNLNIVTNSLEVATLLGGMSSFRVILLGGEINSQYGFTYGSDAQEQISRFSADWAILSVDGISCNGEITTYHAEEAVIDRIMIERAKQVLVVADSSKIGRIGFSRVCSCTPDIKIITNADSSEKYSEEMKKKGINIKFI